MEQGIRGIAGRTALYYLKNVRGRRFLAKLVPALNKSAKIRAGFEKRGRHVPQFLICSVTSQCNLHCKGCYARAGGICSDGAREQLTAYEWKSVFEQAKGLGISFILLAGGEPMLQRDIIEAATEFPAIVFPVFTNGTLFDDTYLDLFDAHRNLIPVLSVEGDGAATDSRRGEGVAARIYEVIDKLHSRGILYAASVTVTCENLREAASEKYLSDLRKRGCGIVFFIEYVPSEKGTEHLILSAEDAVWLAQTAESLKSKYADMCVFSFPGDEQLTGGCLAAGRGFFHINPRGGAEPCPFSPYSALNVREHSLLEVLESPFFEEVRKIECADTSHSHGGCTLFDHADEVRRLIGI